MVIAHHGTSAAAASAIASSGFRVSANQWDWLGDGAYFWQDNYPRAARWAKDHFEGGAAVITVDVSLDDCLDLTQEPWFAFLQRHADKILATRGELKLPALRQRGLFHGKDRYVINFVAEVMEAAGTPFKSVRAAFAEGDPLHPESEIFSLSHVQIAVRDISAVQITSIDYL